MNKLLSYCPHCNDHTSTQMRMYRMNLNLINNYPQICNACGKDKNKK